MHEFHPDKNPDNVFAEARFREIHEAYTILSNEDKRAMYDYERWLSGRFRNRTAVITPEYLLLELQKLNAHLADIDVYRMNKQLLHEYLMFLLNDEKIAIIQLKSTAEITHQVITNILKALEPLPPYSAKEVLTKLKNMAADEDSEQQRIGRVLRKLQREERWQKAFPWLALFITILVCLAMYLFAKK